MAVELTPSGKRGVGMPKLPRPLMKLFIGLNVAFFRLLGRRVRIKGAPLVLLTTVGAKTGQTRQTPLGGFPDANGAWLIVASAAGSAKHPAWYFNLAKNPDTVWLEVEGRKMKVRPEYLKGAEREAAWGRISAQASNYAGYQEKTDREIPIIRLSPEPA